MFGTRWEPVEAAAELEKIIKDERCPYNIHRSVIVDPDRREGYRIYATSVGGFFEDTGVNIRVLKDPVKGAVIIVENDGKSTQSKVNEIEQKLREEYFRT